MKETRQIPGNQHFRAKFDKGSINVDKRTVDVVFVTERQVMTWNWDIGLFYEVLPCNPDAGDLTRLNSGAPVCDTHWTGSVKDGLGVVERAWFDNNVGRATLRFSKREDVEPIWQDVVDGITTGVSVGYIVYEYEEIGIKDNIPLIRGNKWEGTEISLALVQADVDSAVGRSKKDTPDTTHNVTLIRSSTSNNNTMNSKDNNGTEAGTEKPAATTAPTAQAPATEVPAAQPVNEDQVRTQATTMERTRISEITKGCRAVGLPDEFREQLISNGTSLENARAAIIDEAAKSNPVTPRFQSGITTGGDERSKKQIGMEAAIMQRAGILPQDKIGDPGEYRGFSLLDIAKECLTNAGVNIRGLNAMEVANRALQMQGGRDGGGGLSTGDFSYVLANVLNKTLRTMYDLQAKTFLPWTRKSTATNFRQMLRTQLSDIKLSQVSEGGEYTSAQLGDSGETYKVAKWGKIVNIDWEAIMNDDLSAFSRIPSFLAGAVAQMQSDVVYKILTGSHKMYDTVELFDAAHGNYTTPGTALSVASLGVARQMMRDQKSPGDNVLNIAPKFVIVGSQNEALALQYTSTNYVATRQADLNVWAGTLTPIVDARISGKQWFTVADPGLIDTIEWATLEGQEIFSESRYGFDVDALQFKVRSVFGAKAIDWRSLYKNAGA